MLPLRVSFQCGRSGGIAGRVTTIATRALLAGLIVRSGADT
jgi:hypothetical protein